MKSATVKVVANPRYDIAFQAEAAAHARDGVDTPAELEHRLKNRFTRARVVAGITDRGVERWYAYREGYWIEDREPSALEAGLDTCASLHR